MRSGLWGRLAVALAVMAVACGGQDRPESGSVAKLAESEGANAADGHSLYQKHCASCHGANLEGQPEWRRRLPSGVYPAPPHDETGHTWHHDDGLLFRITKEGGQATAPPGFKSGMPAFGGVLSDGEIHSILEFIKRQWPEEIQRQQQWQSRRAAGRQGEATSATRTD